MRCGLNVFSLRVDLNETSLNELQVVELYLCPLRCRRYHKKVKGFSLYANNAHENISENCYLNDTE